MTSMLDGFNIKTEDNLINALVNSWLVSGVIGTSVVTVAMNSLSVMISDKQNKIDYDYNASSVKGSTVVLSYFSGAVINTIVISAILLTAGIAFSCISGSSFPEFTELLKLYGLVILGSVSAVLILMFVASFFKKNSTYAAFNTLISVAIGFVIGAYIPVSQFSDGVQTFVNLIPGSHIAAMIRNVLVSPCINDISTSLAGADHGIFAEEAEKAFATNLNLFGNEVDFTFMMMYSIGAILIFLILNLISYKFSSKRKD
jgi:ABC-type polysaccharide/polyol phosphate export permease